MVQVGGADYLAHPALEQEQLLVGGGGAGDGSHPPWPALPYHVLQPASHGGHGIAIGHGVPLAAPADAGLEEAALVIHEVETVAARVAQPAIVDARVFARHVSHDAVIARLHLGVAAHGAAVTDGRRAAHVPGAGAEAPVGAGQRSHRAQLHDVALEGAFHGLPVEGPDHGVHATVEEHQLALLRDFVEVAQAALARDATFHVEHDPPGQRNRFGVFHLLFEEPARTATVVEAEILQVALPAFVADGAVEGGVYGQEIQHALPRLQHLGALRGDIHAGGDSDGATGRELGLALDLHHAHAAGADGVELAVVAEIGHRGAIVDAHVEQRGALGGNHLAAVDGDVDHLRLARLSHGSQMAGLQGQSG